MSSVIQQDLSNQATAATPSFRLNALHLTILSTFAVAQPLFDLLARQAEFFAVRRSHPIDLFILAIVLIVVVPLPLIALTGSARLFGERAGRTVQAALVGLLVGALLLPPLARAGDLGSPVTFGIVLAVSLLAAVMYARLPSVRGLLTFGSVALVAFPVLFLLDPAIRKIALPSSSIAAIVRAEIQSNTPVVLVVFDAFPTSSLLDEKRGIDAEMFPNFAKLAASSIWFRNATGVAESTVRAVPSILTGQYPKMGLYPTVKDHPNNLFTLLASSYQIHSIEPLTSLNPTDGSVPPTLVERMRSMLADLKVVYLHIVLPKDLTAQLPPITQGWENFAASDQSSTAAKSTVGPDTQFIQFTKDLVYERPQSLWFAHIVLPHGPDKRYASGRLYSPTDNPPSGEGNQWDNWTGDEWSAAHGYQRHLLQVELVDNLLGRFISRLQETGLWDTAVILFVADHGAGYRANDGHRGLTDTNFADILSVPFFLRAPGQAVGQISDANVQTIDVLPTIADLLEITLPWEVDGLSVFDPNIEQRAEKTIFFEGKNGDYKTFPANAIDEARQETVKHKLALFGGASGPDRLFALGPHGDLVGRRLDSFPPPGPPVVAGKLNAPELYRQVSLGANVLPGEIVGMVRQQPGAEPPWIVVAINGVVRAVTRPYERDKSKDAALWAAVVPEESFRAGNNEFELFSLETTSPDSVKLHEVTPLDIKWDFRGVTLGASLVSGVKESGFHTQSGLATPYRWTMGNAKLIVPVDAEDLPHELVIDIFRRGPVPLDLQVKVNDVTLFSGPLPQFKWSKTIDLSSLTPASQLQIELLSETWSPMEVEKGSLDARRLGVAVQGVTLR